MVSSQHLERLFVFCLMWSLGALLELEDRDKLEAYIRAHDSSIDVPQTQSGETMFEYMVNPNGTVILYIKYNLFTMFIWFLSTCLKDCFFITSCIATSVSGEWCHWNNHVGKYVYPTDHVPDYTSILVPNVDNTRTSFLLETIAKKRKVSF